VIPVYVQSTQDGATAHLTAGLAADVGDLAVLIATSNENALTNSATGSYMPTGADNIVDIYRNGTGAAGDGVASGWTLDGYASSVSTTNLNRVHVYSKVLTASDFALGDPTKAMLSVGPTGYHASGATRLQLMLFRDPLGFDSTRVFQAITQVSNISNGSPVASFTGVSKRTVAVSGFLANSSVVWDSESSVGSEPYCNESSLTDPLGASGWIGSHYGTGTGNCQADFRHYDSAPSTISLALKSGLNNNSHVVVTVVYQVKAQDVIALGTAEETNSSLVIVGPPQPRTIALGTAQEPNESQVIAPLLPFPEAIFVASTQNGASATLTAVTLASPGDLAVLIVNSNVTAAPNDTVSRTMPSGSVVVPGGIDGWNLDESAVSNNGTGTVKTQVFSKVLRDANDGYHDDSTSDFTGSSMRAVGPTGYGSTVPTRLQLMIFRSVKGWDSDPAYRIADKKTHTTPLDHTLGVPMASMIAGNGPSAVVAVMNGINSTIKWGSETARDPYCDETTQSDAIPTAPNGVPGEHYGSNSGANQADFHLYGSPYGPTITFASGTNNLAHAFVAVAYHATGDPVSTVLRGTANPAIETQFALPISADKSTEAVFTLSSVPNISYFSKKVRFTGYLETSGQAGQVRVELMDGSTSIQQSSWYTVTTIPTQYEFSVTNTISNYSNLRVKVSARTFGAGTIRVSHLELQLDSFDVSTVIEYEFALPMGRGRGLRRVEDSEAAQPIGKARSVTVGTALETNASLAIRNPFVRLGIAYERNQSRLIDPKPETGPATGTGDYNDSGIDYDDYGIDYNGNIVVLGLNRWQFADSRELWPFEINPATFTSNFYKRSYKAERINKVLIKSGQREQPEMRFSGTILTKSMLETLEYWYEKEKTINLVDDKRRSFTVYITELTPKRVRNATNLWQHTFDCKVLVLDGFQ
jgi:hypothetical protein